MTIECDPQVRLHPPKHASRVLVFSLLALGVAVADGHAQS